MSTAPSTLRQSRNKLSEDLAKHPWLTWYSPAERGLRWSVERQISKYAYGKVLDAGCGFMPYRSHLKERGLHYTSMDIAERSIGVDLIGDVMDMVSIEGDTFDLVLASEVLEHVARPHDAVREIARILKPGGVAIITVPHLSRIHDAPSDYFRFTRYGMEEVAASAGLEVLRIENVGSIFSLLGHQLSSAVVATVWRVPMLRWLMFFLSALLITAPAVLVDYLPPLRTLLPLNVVLVAEKPTNP